MSELYQHRARKRFGQNFLHDAGVIHRILRAIHAREGQRLLEIGPGQGALTEGLLGSGARLDVIELDQDLIPLLKLKFGLESRFSLHQGDALKFDFASLVESGEKLRVVGNLPYNISTPLIFHLLEYAPVIEDMHFMLQKEVVERLAATPGGGDWGRLSIMVQYHCRVEHLFNVGPGAFNPPPKVDSAIVRLTPLRRAAPSGTRSETARAGGPRGLQPAPQDPAQHPQASPERRGHRGRRGRSDPPSRTTRPGRIRPPGQPAGRAARQSLV